MSDEVLTFAKAIGAKDLKETFSKSEFRSLFKRRNYFLVGNNTFLVVKISRNKIHPFYGFGKAFFDLFNMLTEKNGNYYFVGLTSEKSGWVLSKKQILNMKKNNSLSASSDGKEFKINYYNLKDQDSFLSVNSFLKKIGISSQDS
jgi:hypothetical protein